MIAFSNCKINIGLNILNKRGDNFHNIETIFYPIPFFDIIEILPSEKFELINEGIKIDCEIEKNLCYKAFKIIENKFDINPVKIILYKNIPFGTGLGAGSANATFTIKLLNEFFDLKISKNQMKNFASKIGADCPFFIENKPVFASGTGNILEEIFLCLDNYFIVIAIPEISVNTALAYKNSTPAIPQENLKNLIKLPILEWKNCIKNDFEKNVFAEFPILENIKNEMYENGAIYAQMSGSGSSVFGIFEKNPEKIKLKFCENLKILKLNALE
ncbi:MAG: 4-(cytidine 5'-diphospho)-2-C-methyl-D-erythritol kinase [Bacteroidales bacterium]|jgi:4-diphosphocytidyl-2-C-methyl-D-erythritol kinase|nr:4-(cytidine 5'-diphospho)-2-C-methyl-D-erythritol kinase [Bacteroidales bacterium]